MIKIPRLPWDEFFMLHAHLAATRSTCDRGPELLLDPGRRGVGAVLVRENRIVAGGYNGSPPGEPHCDRYFCPECEVEFEEDELEPTAGSPRIERGPIGGPATTVCPICTRRVLEGGHLLVDGHCVRTIHSEENALLQCALDGVSPSGTTVYTTASPCYDCAKRLVRVGVVRVCHGEEYGSRYGLSGDALALLRRVGIAVERVDISGIVRGSSFTF